MFIRAKNVIAAAVVALVTLAASRASADTANAAGGFMTFGGGSSEGTDHGLCISNEGSSGVLQESCAVTSGVFDTSSKQDFHVLQVNGAPAGVAEIRSYITGLDKGCLAIHNNDPTTGILEVDSCTGTGKDEWTFSNGHLVPYLHNTYCVGVTGGSETTGTAITISACNSGLAQTFLPVNFTVQMDSSSGCLDVNGNSTTPKFLDVYTCGTTNTAQWFIFQPETTAYFHGTLIAQHSDLFVGWDEVDHDPAATMYGLGGNAYNMWSYSRVQLLVNSDTAAGHTLYTCLDLATSGSPLKTAENGCGLIGNVPWNMTIQAM